MLEAYEGVKVPERVNNLSLQVAQIDTLFSALMNSFSIAVIYGFGVHGDQNSD